MAVIGLTGYAGSGKSAVAQFLVEDHGFTRLSFAAPLKRMVRTLDPIIANDGRRLSDLWDPHQGDESHIKKWYPEYRRVLRVLATECIREHDPDFWVKAALSQIETFKNYVFDDCRFPNEAELVLDWNLHGLWNISRPGLEATNSHASEQHAGKLAETVWISNDGTLEDLRGYVAEALAEMTVKRA